MRHLGGRVELDGADLPVADGRAMQPRRMTRISLVPQYAMSALNPTRRIGRLATDLLRSHGVRGEWLKPGALVCAAGANNPRSRELDNVVLERASFVCCDWLEQARIESADLIEPVERGVLDWLEVHQLHEVVAGELPGRQSPDDIVVFKSNGIAAWDIAIAAAAVERARERHVGTDV